MKTTSTATAKKNSYVREILISVSTNSISSSNGTFSVATSTTVTGHAQDSNSTLLNSPSSYNFWTSGVGTTGVSVPEWMAISVASLTLLCCIKLFRCLGFCKLCHDWRKFYFFCLYLYLNIKIKMPKLNMHAVFFYQTIK
jgi:hypothetical protein